MLKNRLFNALMAVAFVLTVALTAREAIAQANIMAQGHATAGANVVECTSLPSRYSIHTEIVKATGTRVIVTEDGPAGLDGGFKELMTAYRTCSR